MDRGLLGALAGRIELKVIEQGMATGHIEQDAMRTAFEPDLLGRQPPTFLLPTRMPPFPSHCS